MSSDRKTEIHALLRSVMGAHDFISNNIDYLNDNYDSDTVSHLIIVNDYLDRVSDYIKREAGFGKL
jgi:uncharacterized protein YeeX (DUF496 family)